MQEAHTTPEAAGDLRFDPSVFAVGHDYQIIFLTARKGIGWIEIAGERFTDEECGLLQYGRVHKIQCNRIGGSSEIYGHGWLEY